MIRVVISAASHTLRAGLRALLETAALPGSQVQVIDEAPDLESLGDSLDSADVLLLAAGSIDQQHLADRLPADGRLAVLLLADDPEGWRTLMQLPARAWGMLNREVEEGELLAAVQALSQGLWVGSPEWIEAALLRRVPAGPVRKHPAEALTEREAQVLQLLVEGLANKQIATALGISEHTVKFHVSAVYAKLGAGSRTEAVRLGVQGGLAFL